MRSQQIYRSLPFLLGVLLLVLSVAPVLVGLAVTDLSMTEVYADLPSLPPGLGHLLGTQSEGRDVLSLLRYAIPATLTVGFLGGGLAVLFGLSLGLIAGYVGGKFDSVIRAVTDVGLTIPPLAVLILIAASVQTLSVPTMGVIVALTAWMVVTRVIRSQVLTISQREYVRVAKLSGLTDFEIIAKEIFPNLIPFIASTLVNAVTAAIMAAIGLEVLGLGPKNTFTLGSMIYDSIYYSAMSRGMWWWWVPPIVVLVLVFCGLFLVSVALDRFANPRSETVS